MSSSWLVGVLAVAAAFPACGGRSQREVPGDEDSGAMGERSGTGGTPRGTGGTGTGGSVSTGANGSGATGGTGSGGVSSGGSVGVGATGAIPATGGSNSAATGGHTSTGGSNTGATGAIPATGGSNSAATGGHTSTGGTASGAVGGGGSTRTCWYGGVYYTLGAQYPAGDNCNTCTCTEAGSDCSSIICGEPACPTVSNEYQSALVDARRCAPGGGADQCRFRAPTVLGCSCGTPVNDVTAIDALLDDWLALGCQEQAQPPCLPCVEDYGYVQCAPDGFCAVAPPPPDGAAGAAGAAGAGGEGSSPTIPLSGRRRAALGASPPPAPGRSAPPG